MGAANSKRRATLTKTVDSSYQNRASATLVTSAWRDLDGPSFPCNYLGHQPVNKSVTGISCLQTPVKESYLSYRLSGSNSHRSALKLIQSGLLVTFFEHSVPVSEFFLDYASILVVEAVKFTLVDTKSKKKLKAVFVPLDDSKNVVSDKLAFKLEQRFDFLGYSGHKPLVACVTKRSSSSKFHDCHIFQLESVEDSLHVVHLIESSIVPEDELFKNNADSFLHKSKSDTGSCHYKNENALNVQDNKRNNLNKVQDIVEPSFYQGSHLSLPPVPSPWRLRVDQLRSSSNVSRCSSFNKDDFRYSQPASVYEEVGESSLRNSFHFEKKDIKKTKRPKSENIFSTSNQTSNILQQSKENNPDETCYSVDETKLSVTDLTNSEKSSKLSPKKTQAVINAQSDGYIKVSPVKNARRSLYYAETPLCSASSLECRETNNFDSDVIETAEEQDTEGRPIAKVPPYVKAGIKVLPKDFLAVKLKTKMDKKSESFDEDFQNSPENKTDFTSRAIPRNFLSFDSGYKLGELYQQDIATVETEPYQHNSVKLKPQKVKLRSKRNGLENPSMIRYSSQGKSDVLDFSKYRFSAPNNSHELLGQTKTNRNSEHCGLYFEFDPTETVVTADIEEDPDYSFSNRKDEEIANLFTEMELSNFMNYKGDKNSTKNIEHGLGYLP